MCDQRHVSRTNTVLTDVAQDAAWLAHRYDPGHDAVHFQWAPRDVHRRTTFLTDAELPADSRKIVLRRADAVAAAPSEAPLHFIFHSAYCCSTLLARAFDREGHAMGLKEPVILNDIVGWRRRGAEPRNVAMVLDHALRLLGRPFGAGEAVVVKPSNVVNGLAAAMLGMRPQSRALLLYAPLETYLASIAKKGMWGRLWVRELLVGQLAEGLHPFGFDQKDYLGQTDLQVAAIGWLAQHALFAQLVARFGAERVRTLGSETLVAEPAAAMSALNDLFGLDMAANEVEAIANGPAFTRHSKLDEDFSAADRQAEHLSASAMHAEEIEKVTAWAAAVAASAGISMAPGAPLIR